MNIKLFKIFDNIKSSQRPWLRNRMEYWCNNYLEVTCFEVQDHLTLANKKVMLSSD